MTLSEVVLTFDTDWVPQYMVDHCLNTLREAGLPATFFCTGPYDFVEPPARIERAIHPNFLPGSTHGEGVEEVLDGLCALYPEAVGSRSHGLFWYSNLSRPLLKRGMLYDASIRMVSHPHLQPVMENGLIRFPIWWSDNHWLKGGSGDDGLSVPALREAGLKVMLFHPVHVWYNTPALDWFTELRRSVDDPLALDHRRAEALRFEGEGVGTRLRHLLGWISGSGCRVATLAELARERLKPC
jgi:peptidoglycan/xylan/chitin deacetylase (PgdA/CDA1 family)